MNTQKITQVKDLADQILDKSRASELLYCPVCGAENSVNKGDYFMARPSHVCECCDAPMLLVTRQMVYSEVQ